MSQKFTFLKFSFKEFLNNATLKLRTFIFRKKDATFFTSDNKCRAFFLPYLSYNRAYYLENLTIPQTCFFLHTKVLPIFVSLPIDE